jgi:outer membrane protein assembly factor BamD (BamD/ComL family)
MPLGVVPMLPCVAGVNYNGFVMAKAASKSKSALDTLIQSVSLLRSEAKERMSKEEFRQAEEKFDEVVSRVRASRGRKRETA